MAAKILRKSVFYIVFIVLLGSCSDQNNNDFPFAYVNITIDMQNPLYLGLQNVGESVIIPNEGYNNNGVIVYRSGIDEIKAYDCSCTFHDLYDCSIEQSETSIVNAVCTCCDSKFELFYGSVSVGPAIKPLKEYRTSFDGTFINIYN